MLSKDPDTIPMRITFLRNDPVDDLDDDDDDDDGNDDGIDEMLPSSCLAALSSAAFVFDVGVGAFVVELRLISRLIISCLATSGWIDGLRGKHMWVYISLSREGSDEVE